MNILTIAEGHSENYYEITFDGGICEVRRNWDKGETGGYLNSLRYTWKPGAIKTTSFDWEAFEIRNWRALCEATAAFENCEDYINENGTKAELIYDALVSKTAPDSLIELIAQVYANKEFKIKELWGDKIIKVKVVGVEYDGDEFIDLMLDKDVLLARTSVISDEFRKISGYPNASFTEIGAMREGALRFAIHGW